VTPATARNHHNRATGCMEVPAAESRCKLVADLLRYANAQALYLLSGKGILAHK
jgi:hypothetical protein